MDIIVSARHFDLSEALKVAAESATHAALDDITLKISSVRIVLDIQKNIHRADVVVNIKSYQVSASAETLGDMNKSIVDALEKAGVQARKYLEKKQDRRDRENIRTDVPETETEDEEK